MKLKKTNQLDIWWARGLMFVVFAGLSYGFFSLAIDSAKMIEYLLGIIFFIWSIKSLIKAGKLVFQK